ncbi:hypothetical protein DYH10_00350 [Candidatus Saccharibacteria bacterium CPR2]|nr:hypothetical protein [Candidatus Saccharibacteria bacterium CPR2]
MNADVIMAISLGGIALLCLLLRTNISLAILGLTAGYVLSDLLTDEVVNFLRARGLDDSSVPLTTIVTIAIILLPALVILIRFRGYQSSRFLQHIVPSIAFALLSGLLVLQNLPLNITENIKSQSYVYGQLRYFEVLIIAITITIAVFDILMHEHERQRKLDKHSKKRGRG